jgi:undecaprenyl-diphosphatase
VAPQVGVPFIDWFLSLLDAWGYLIVFGFTIFENIFIIGSLTPGETFVIAAAFVSNEGSLWLPYVWISSFVGTMIGSNITYLLGRRAGIETMHRVVERISATRIGRLAKIDVAVLDEVVEHFEMDGSKTVFFSRFAVGAKNMVPAVAGAVRMPVYWFEFHTIFSAVVYGSLMCLIGWFLGENMDVALRIATSAGWVGLLIMAIFLTFLIAGRKRYKAAKAAKQHEVGEDGRAR